MFDGDLRPSFNAAPVTISLSDFAVHPETRCLTLPDGCRLDFGGVAKGWAAQQAAIRLAAAGPALVNAGGDIAITGLRPGGESWPVGVADPFRPSMHLEILHLEGGGVATSGKDYRRWTVNGQRQHHLIDPRTGLPAESDVLAATVIAPTVMIAEALAKLVLLSGSAAGLHLLDGDPALAGVIVLENGQCLYSRTAEDYL
jgi:thiamine biosynthesis lipoprotein